MFLFWMFLRALTRSPVAVAAEIVAAEILALRQQLAIYHLEVVPGQSFRANRRPGCFRPPIDYVLAAVGDAGSVARPPPRAALPRGGLRRHCASDLGLDGQPLIGSVKAR